MRLLCYILLMPSNLVKRCGYFSWDHPSALKRDKWHAQRPPPTLHITSTPTPTTSTLYRFLNNFAIYTKKCIFFFSFRFLFLFPWINTVHICWESCNYFYNIYRCYILISCLWIHREERNKPEDAKSGYEKCKLQTLISWCAELLHKTFI